MASGYLEKKGDAFPWRWQSRYFIRNGQTVKYYPDEAAFKNGADPLGSFTLIKVSSSGEMEAELHREGKRPMQVKGDTHFLEPEPHDESGPQLSLETGEGTNMKVDLPEPDSKVGLEDFDLLTVLGKGGFGKVMLVKKKGTDQLFAMKVLKKQAVVRRNQVTHTKAEHHILCQVQHPFLTTMHYAFQSEGKLYMVLNYLQGGELFYRLRKEGRFSVNRVRLYSAEIALGLGHLHSLDMVYRDLKPENLLLDENGHICLTDFGLSKEAVTTQNGAQTFCGTPEYLAPEILQNRGHGKAVDWWSLGTLVYEMLTGLPPYYDRNVNKMYEKILKAKLNCPPSMAPEVKDLIERLLVRDPAGRLGGGPGDVQELRQHAFYAQLDWDKVYNKQYTPEYKPEIKAMTDTANFDPAFTKEAAIDSVVDPSALRPGDKEAFDGFTFTAPSQLAGK